MKLDKITVDIVFPIYNEASILADKIRDVVLSLSSDDGLDWRIIIISNGSTDKTDEIGDSLVRKYSKVSFFSISEKGRGRALKKAFCESSSSVFVYLDIDWFVDIRVLSMMIGQAVKYNVAVIANRLALNCNMRRPKYRIILSRIYSRLVNFFFSFMKVEDTQVGIKVFPHKILELFLNKVKNNNFFFDTELLLLIKTAGFSIIQIPMDCYDMRDRMGVFGLLQYICECFCGLIRMRFKLTVLAMHEK